MEKYYDIKELIRIASDSGIVDFAEFGNGISDEGLSKAEERLGFSFPNSYRWWLKNYSGGEICGEEIFSVYCKDFDTIVGGDIVYMYELNCNNKVFDKDMLVFCEANDEVFYFDLKTYKEGECSVYELNSNTLYADDFIGFLNKRIGSYLAM